MCGITGLVDSSGSGGIAMIVPMTASLCHRGPDDEGYLLADSRTHRLMQCGGPDSMPGVTGQLAPVPQTKQDWQEFDLALGHRRLSILDLSAAGHCPMPSADGQAWITYNGEVYNYVELGAELERLGYRFRSGSDAEVVVNAYVEWGPDCLRRFNGMWAFAIWDVHRRQVFCARDRFGIKPFHYYWDGRFLAFASEIKALLAHPDIPRRPNDGIIYDYLVLGSLDHTDETFFEGVRRLPASHYLLFDLDQGRLEVRRWWDVEANAALNGSIRADDRELAVEFRELLTDAVRLRLRSDVPIGTCLSGGLDSSSIVSLANRLMLEEGAVPRELVGERQKTFSACFDDPAIDERPYIRQIIEHTQAESNQVFPQGKGRLWDEIEQLVWHQEEPFGSTGIYSQWNVMRLARQHGVTVLLDGQGGDELLAGYHHYLGPFLAQTMRARGLLSALQAGRAASATTGQSMVLLLGLWLYNSLPDRAQRLMLGLGNARFRSNPTVSPSAMLEPSFARRFRETWLMHGKHRGYDILAERLYQDVFVHSLPALLRYEDRNSMAFSLEARVPFLDHRLVECVFSLPATCRVRDGWTKWILRQAMEGILPEGIRWRRGKLGFATPEARWLREGSGWIRSLFNAGEVLSTPYLNARTIRRLQSLVDDGQADISGLWRVLNLELWLRVFWGKEAAR
jgi:asparagine synthase (glutamine-hydrolysing)